MVFKKIIFQNRYVALETPSRPPPFMANSILNFHFDYWNTSLTLTLKGLDNAVVYQKWQLSGVALSCHRFQSKRWAKAYRYTCFAKSALCTGDYVWFVVCVHRSISISMLINSANVTVNTDVVVNVNFNFNVSSFLNKCLQGKVKCRVAFRQKQFSKASETLR